MKKKIKKRTESVYLKSISNIVDLFYENRQLKRNINKAKEHLKESIYNYLKEDKDLDGSYNVMTCKTFKEKYLIPVLKILEIEE